MGQQRKIEFQELLALFTTQTNCQYPFHNFDLHIPHFNDELGNIMLFRKTTPKLRKILAALTVPLVLAASAASAADTPSASRTFNKLYAFGDSYTNNGQPLPAFGDIQGYYYPSQWVKPEEFNGPFVALPWILFRTLGMDEKPEVKPINPWNPWTDPWNLSNLSVYGWSGATMTDKARKVSNAFLAVFKPTLSEQVNWALNGYPGAFSIPRLPASPKVNFTDKDVVLVNFGLSDVYQIARNYDNLFFPAADTAQPYLDGMELAKEAGIQVKKLADAGAKTIIFDAFSGVDFVGATFVDVNGRSFVPRANQFAQTYFAALKTELASATASGTKIYLIDMNEFFLSIRDKLSQGAKGTLISMVRRRSLNTMSLAAAKVILWRAGSPPRAHWMTNGNEVASWLKNFTPQQVASRFCLNI